MIITQTPLRISFFGGGTDFREYYERDGGWVLSSAIDKYVYVIVKERYDERIRVGYTQTELVEHVDEIRHDLVRECMRRVGLRGRVEIATMADIPSEGSGLGSSSTVTVGLLTAMYALLGTPQDAETLAQQACEIEIDRLRRPMGVQDQYIAAYGGQRFLHFHAGGDISAERLALSGGQRRALSDHLMLFYTRITRRAESVLQEQVSNIDQRRHVLDEMKRLALQGRHLLLAGALDDFGLLLHESWQLKKQLASRISNPEIDELYARARAAGALGGKISGAGNGGYLLLVCSPGAQAAVRAALHPLEELPFNLAAHGSRVIFNCHE